MPEREVCDPANRADRQHGPRDLRRPRRPDPEQRVERVVAKPGQREAERARRVEEIELDPVRAREQPILPVYADRRHDHHRDDHRRPDRSKETERDEQATGHLGDRGHARERPPTMEAELNEELAGRVEAVASEPSQELLRAVRSHEQPDHQAGDQQRKIQHARVGGIRCVHNFPQCGSTLVAWLPSVTIKKVKSLRPDEKNARKRASVTLE
jgi:hypothetical protein